MHLENEFKAFKAIVHTVVYFWIKHISFRKFFHSVSSVAVNHVGRFIKPAFRVHKTCATLYHSWMLNDIYLSEVLFFATIQLLSPLLDVRTPAIDRRTLNETTRVKRRTILEIVTHSLVARII